MTLESTDFFTKNCVKKTCENVLKTADYLSILKQISKKAVEKTAVLHKLFEILQLRVTFPLHVLFIEIYVGYKLCSQTITHSPNSSCLSAHKLELLLII